MGKVLHMSHIEKRTLQDGKTSWLIMFRYTDWQGKRRQKKASGFPTKREALAYERDFIEREAGSPSMTFGNLWAIYKKDLQHRVKESSMHSIIPNVERRVLPYFKDMPINQITPAIVRRWETELHDSTELSDRFIQYLHGRLSSVLSFACKYYSLPRNPAKIAGTTVKSTPAQQAIQFWTVEQFKAFDRAAEGEEPYRTLFRLLFWSGLRVGEAFALTVQDIDLQAGSISVSKTYHRYDAKDKITTPKTAHSNRTVSIPPQLCQALSEHIQAIPNPTPHTRLFESLPFNYNLTRHFHKIAEKAGLPLIKIHDLRHSHASMLIQKNVPPIVIRDRLGHKSIQTTLDIYSHLYPVKGQEVADILANIW